MYCSIELEFSTLLHYTLCSSAVAEKMLKSTKVDEERKKIGNNVM